MAREMAVISRAETSAGQVAVGPSIDSLMDGWLQVQLGVLESSRVSAFTPISQMDPELAAVITEMVARGGWPTAKNFAWADRALGLA